MGSIPGYGTLMSGIGKTKNRTSAKSPTLLDLGKTVEIAHCGAKDWRKILNEDQQKEFDEFMAWMKSGNPGDDRPTKKQAIELISQRLRRITQHTFDKYFNAK